MPHWKPKAGTAQREKRLKRAALERRERELKAQVRERDGYACRWPSGGCSGGIEVAHTFADKGMGGDHGLRTTTGNLMVLCAGHHRGTVSLHSGDLKVVAITDKGTDGPCVFYRRGVRIWREA